jgi:hypothetical protein
MSEIQCFYLGDVECATAVLLLAPCFQMPFRYPSFNVFAHSVERRCLTGRLLLARFVLVQVVYGEEARRRQSGV